MLCDHFRTFSNFFFLPVGLFPLIIIIIILFVCLLVNRLNLLPASLPRSGALSSVLSTPPEPCVLFLLLQETGLLGAQAQQRGGEGVQELVEFMLSPVLSFRRSHLKIAVGFSVSPGKGTRVDGGGGEGSHTSVSLD